MSVEIGSVVKRVLKNRGVAYKDLGALINRHEKSVANILKRKTVDTDLLLSLSKALQHDFFQYYYNEAPLKSFRETELDSLNEELEKLKRELAEKLNYIAVQDKYVKSQEDVIRLLKEKETYLKI